VDARTPVGTLPTFFEPSAFFGWTTTQMKLDFAVDSVRSSGLVVESLQLVLGPSTSLANDQARLEQSGLATVAALAAQAGAQFLLQVHGMPRWISKSQVTATPPGSEEEWPTYQTVAPDPAKWAHWEAAIAATVTYFNVTRGLDNVWYQLWEEPDAPCFWTDTQANYLETWRHFVAGARSVDPAARLGGPEPAGGPDSVKPGESVPLLQAFIEFSAAEGIRPDFISYHLFGSPPEQNRRANRRVLDLSTPAASRRFPSSWEAQASRHRRGDDEPADRPGRERPAPRPHHRRRRRPRRPHGPLGIEVVEKRRRHDVEVLRRGGGERHRRRDATVRQADRHAARQAESPRPGARRRALRARHRWRESRSGRRGQRQGSAAPRRSRRVARQRTA
jgi:hypothetical protein